MSKTLQGKDTSIEEAVSAINLGKRFYQRQRKDEEFNRFYDHVVEEAKQLKELLRPVLLLESILLKAANGEECSKELQELEKSCYKHDLDVDRLQRQLLLLVDVIKQGTPSVKKVTTVCTICDAMNVQPAYKATLSEVQKLLHLFLTIPLTFATAERMFSALRRLVT